MTKRLPKTDEPKFVSEMYIGMLVVTHYDPEAMKQLRDRLKAEGFKNVHAYNAHCVDGVVTDRELLC